MTTSQESRRTPGNGGGSRFFVVGILLFVLGAYTLLDDQSLLSAYSANLPRDAPRTAINKTKQVTKDLEAAAEFENDLDMIDEEILWGEEDDDDDKHNDDNDSPANDTEKQQQPNDKKPNNDPPAETTADTVVVDNNTPNNVVDQQPQEKNVTVVEQTTTTNTSDTTGAAGEEEQQNGRQNKEGEHKQQPQQQQQQPSTDAIAPTIATKKKKNGFKFYILQVPRMTTDLVANNTERATMHYKTKEINEGSAEVWLHRGMSSLSYEQGQTMDPSEADVFLIPAYLRLRNTFPKAERVDMFPEIMNAVHNKSKPHIWMSPTENPGVCGKLGLRALAKQLQKELPDYYSLGLERNSLWQGVATERIIPIPYVLRPHVPPDQIAKAFSHNRTENFVFFRANARDHAIEWAGCNRSVVLPLYDHPNMSVQLTGNSAGRLTQDEYNHLMSTSDFCLVMCGDTPTSRSLVSSVMAGCLPILVGRWWEGLCDPPCKKGWGWNVAGQPHFPFANEIRWDLMPVANHSQFEKDPNATLTALFQQYPKARKDKIRSEMQRVQKWLVYGWGDPVTSTTFGNVYPHLWKSIQYRVGLTETKEIE